MDRMKLYFDTSAIGFLDEPANPKEMADMHSLWEKLKDEEYEIFLSMVTIQEINDNKNKEKVRILYEYLAQIKYTTLEFTDEVVRIADLVKKSGLLTLDKHLNDRFHIGFAIVFGMDFLISMNFKDLANASTNKSVQRITLSEGYGSILIIPPVMMIGREV